MTTIAIEQAKQNLTALVQRALDGEEIIIEADSRKVRLSPLPASPRFDAETARRRGYGSMQGQFVVTDAFFDPLPQAELELWDGSGAP
jgi:antitoxin (DNA-binding transcriptional repressor) of toxin-antitoxin stability system